MLESNPYDPETQIAFRFPTWIVAGFEQDIMEESGGGIDSSAPLARPGRQSVEKRQCKIPNRPRAVVSGDVVSIASGANVGHVGGSSS